MSLTVEMIKVEEPFRSNRSSRYSFILSTRSSRDHTFLKIMQTKAEPGQTDFERVHFYKNRLIY